MGLQILWDSVADNPGEDLVSAEVGGEGEWEGGVEFDAVSVGIFLLGRVVIVVPERVAS